MNSSKYFRKYYEAIVTCNMFVFLTPGEINRTFCTPAPKDLFLKKKFAKKQFVKVTEHVRGFVQDFFFVHELNL